MNEDPLATLLKTFPHTRYYSEWRLLTWHPRGLFDDALADKLIRVIGSEERVEEVPFLRYDRWPWHRPDVRSAHGGGHDSSARIPRARRGGGMARCAIGNSSA